MLTFKTISKIRCCSKKLKIEVNAYKEEKILVFLKDKSQTLNSQVEFFFKEITSYPDVGN